MRGGDHRGPRGRCESGRSAAADSPACHSPAAVAACPPHCYPLCCTAGGFVIDEDGLGYADVGEEVDWGVEEEQQAEDAGSGGKKGKKGA